MMSQSHNLSFPQGLKSLILAILSGVAKEAAEEEGAKTSAAKAAERSKALIAALKRCATQNPAFSAACEAAAENTALVAVLKPFNPACEKHTTWEPGRCATQKQNFFAACKASRKNGFTGEVRGKRS